MIASQAHRLLSRWYYWDRARAGRMAGDREIADREAMFLSSVETLRVFQLNRLRALLQHAQEHVPYYRQIFHNAGFQVESVDSAEAIRELPVLDKPAIRAAGKLMLSEAVRPEDVLPNASGGSTGAPLQFYQDRRYERAQGMATCVFDSWTGWRRSEPVARLWGAPTDIARYGLLRERFRWFLQNRFLLDAFNVNEAKLDQAVRLISRRRPTLILAYASSAYLLARYMQAQSLTFGYAPRAAISSAEVLWPHYRTLIESQFGCRVFNRYGSREVGLIAMECAYGRMHVNEVDVLVEVEQPDASGTGALVITQLSNLAFPFIRYQIGDRGRLGGRDCPCGRRLLVLADLAGRVSDHIVACDGTIIHGEWFTHLFYDVEGVALFTFRQTAPTRYVLEIQKDVGFSPERFERAVAKARQRLGPAAAVEVRFVERFEATPSGKHCYVLNACPPSASILARSDHPSATPTGT